MDKKKIAKIFTIIGMVAGACAILPLIFGFIHLKKMKEGTMTTTDKILNLIFVNVISGILLLIDKEDQAVVE